MNEPLFPIAVFHWNSENGKRLREIRDSVGYSREFLSEAADISISHLQNLEDPKLVVRKTKAGVPYQVTVSLQKLLSVSKCLEVPIYTFFSKEERVSILIAFGLTD